MTKTAGNVRRDVFANASAPPNQKKNVTDKSSQALERLQWKTTVLLFNCCSRLSFLQTGRNKTVQT